MPTPCKLCGVPSLSLPLLKGAHRMPLGVQLVGPRGDDARLLQAARWLVDRVHDSATATKRKHRSGGTAVFEIIIVAVGILLSVLYVGFLAYSIGAVPLWLIAAATCALMVYAFVGELRNARSTPEDNDR